MRPSTKTTSEALTDAGERPARYAVRRTRQKTGKIHGHRFRPAPVPWANLTPAVKFGPGVLLIRAPAGAQRSGSGGERRKERSLSGIFGVSRKCSGGVSSDEDRARPAKVSREAARGPSGGFSLFLRAEKGPPPEPSEAGPVGRGGRNGARAEFSALAGNAAAEFLPTIWGVHMHQPSSWLNSPPARKGGHTGSP